LYVKNGSRIHYASLDASKAFDQVLHYGRFYKMNSKGIPMAFVNVLIF